MVGSHFHLYLGAYSGVMEPLQKFFQASVSGPRRKTGGKSSATSDVGIHVSGYVLPGIARCLNLINNFGHIAPAGLAGDFKMENFDGKIGFTANAQSFFNRLWLGLALAAHVRSVNAAVSRSNLCQFNQFIGRCVMPRWIDQRRGNAQSAVAHGLI